LKDYVVFVCLFSQLTDVWVGQVNKRSIIGVLNVSHFYTVMY